MIRWGGVRPGLMDVGQGRRGGGASGQAKAKRAERGKKAGRGVMGTWKLGQAKLKGARYTPPSTRAKVVQTGAGSWQTRPDTRTGCSTNGAPAQKEPRAGYSLFAGGCCRRWGLGLRPGVGRRLLVHVEPEEIARWWCYHLRACPSMHSHDLLQYMQPVTHAGRHEDEKCLAHWLASRRSDRQTNPAQGRRRAARYAPHAKQDPHQRRHFSRRRRRRWLARLLGVHLPHDVLPLALVPSGQYLRGTWCVARATHPRRGCCHVTHSFGVTAPR